ncbi:hypothetical protein [Mitsuokella jalaludinii]|uniref:hypothetical protein n=1 Tax=Mitsuokella jalaludinii TaxID=187979 RepID=UPI00307E4368
MRRSIYEPSFAWKRYRAQRDRRQQRQAALYEVLHFCGCSLKTMMVIALLYIGLCILAV